MNYPLLIFFGVIPSIIWLLFFLRKDTHPESNKMIIKVFIWGMISSIPILFVEVGLENLLKNIPLILFCFFSVALPEELAKYLVVKKIALPNKEMDEPVDAMIYMIIAALGFAALENILMLWPFKAFDLFTASWLRFITGTFLHVVTAGIMGYFIALSFLNVKIKRLLIFLGILIASILHSAYNFYIIVQGAPKTIVLLLLILPSIFVFIAFEKIKKEKIHANFKKNRTK
jgi:RsiW-degrading membrane proteinase PrsW (M82 family)